MPNSPLVLTKFGFGRWDEGVWIDIGIKMVTNEPAVAYSVVPQVIRLYYLANGDFDHVTFEGMSMSLLVPGVLYLRGRLNFGETVTEASLQGWFVSSPGLAMKSYEKRENWQWDVGAQYRKATLPDGTDTSVVFAWLKTSTGIPNPLLPGTALYGGHFLYGKKRATGAGRRHDREMVHRSRAEEPDRDRQVGGQPRFRRRSASAWFSARRSIAAGRGTCSSDCCGTTRSGCCTAT